ARIELYSAMGKQIRDVRSGEGFAYMSSLNTHFGIGTDTEIEKIIIRWPSGILDVIENPVINTSLVAVEGEHQMGVDDANAVQFIIYPNTVSDMFNVQSNTYEHTTYKISHITAQLVQKGKLDNGKIYVSQLNKCIFIISLKQDNKKSN